MIFRQAKQEEYHQLFEEAYKVWPRGRTFQQYCEDNRKEDAYGTRYVLEVEGEIVCSLIFLQFPSEGARRRFGIGSVVTPQRHRNNGYATKLLEHCLRQVSRETDIVLLYSDVHPSFYERLHFRVLPINLQKKAGSVCMVLCGDTSWEDISSGSIDSIPDYF